MKKDYSKLIKLADACNTGACNAKAIILSLSEAIDNLDTHEVNNSCAVKCILGQLEYLCNESCGPRFEVMEEYDRWKAWLNKDQTLTWEQAEAIHTQKQRWAKVGDPVPVIGGDGAVAVDVGSMVLCIEKDGYCHS